MSLLTVSGICRKEEGISTVQDISFTLPHFKKLAIAGATGSGKTSLLKMIGGLLQPSAGEVLLEKEKVKGPDETLIAGHPRIAYLSQHFELRHHYTVEEILEKANILSHEEAAIIYAACRINHLFDRLEHHLSGGEKQRVALARLLVGAPGLLLLDEPFSNLDALHKNLLKTVVADICETLQITCIIVSHDPVDILSWADEIIVLKNGRMVQQATAYEIYHQPANEYIAALFGKYNVLTPSLAKALSFFTDIEMQYINSFLRPEKFILVDDGDTGLQGFINETQFMGSHYEIRVAIAGTVLTIHTSNGRLQKGDVVYVALKNLGL